MIGRHITVPALKGNSILSRACDKRSKILGEAVTSESQARHWNFSKTVAYKTVRLGLKRS